MTGVEFGLGVLASVLAAMLWESTSLWRKYQATRKIQDVLDELCRTAPIRVLKVPGHPNAYWIALDPKGIIGGRHSVATVEIDGSSIIVTVTHKGKVLLTRKEYSADQFYNLLRKAELYARTHGVEALKGYSQTRIG